MALPKPPGAPAATPTPAAAPVAAAPAPAPTPAPAATPAAAAGEKKKPAQFGPGRGPDAIAIPVINEVNLSNLFESLKATIESNVGDSGAFVDAFEALNKGHFPGDKTGRAAYDAARIVGIVHKRSKGPAQRASGGGKVAKLQGLLEKLLGSISADALAAAGLSVEDITAATK